MTGTIAMAIWQIGPVLAQVDADPMGLVVLVRHLIAAAVFSIMGIVIFGASVWLLARLLPFSMRKEIEEDQNVAFGVIIAGLFIGIALIIAAAIMG